MSYEIAKLLLEHADTFLKRRDAIATALSLGMPMNEIEQYLDWLDSIRNGKNSNGQHPPAKGPDSPPPTSS